MAFSTIVAIAARFFNLCKRKRRIISTLLRSELTWIYITVTVIIEAKKIAGYHKS